MSDPSSAPPAFSVCIPNFNYGHYIGATIQSVLDQTYPHYEIVVVDNDSTDDSVAVVESFRSDRIRLYRNPYNIGFAPNLDRAASHAANAFIIMLSSDDLMKPTALEEYARVLATLGPDAENALVASAVEDIDGAGNYVGVRTKRDFLPFAPDAALTARVGDPAVSIFTGTLVFQRLFPQQTVPGAFCATAYSRTLYGRVGGYASVNTMGPDAHFAYKTLLLGARVVFIDRPLFQYRVHGTNQTSQDRGGRTIKEVIDRYLFTRQYSDEELRRAGLERETVARAMIDKICLRAAATELRRGANGYACRLLAFALAAYPSLTLRNPKFYGLVLLLSTGPLGTAVAHALWRLRGGRDRHALTESAESPLTVSQ